MVKEIERRGEVVGIEVKSVGLVGLVLVGCFEEVFVLYGVLRREGVFLEVYLVGILLVGLFVFFFVC